jgi:hypothetical protein
MLVELLLCYLTKSLKLLLTEIQGENPATCANREGFTIPPPGATTSTPPASSTHATAKATPTTTNGSLNGTSTAPITAFTGAAVRKDSAARVIVVGAMGILAAL